MNQSFACVADVFHFFQPNEIVVRGLLKDVVLRRHAAPPAKTRRKRGGADIVLLARDLQAFNSAGTVLIVASARLKGNVRSFPFYRLSSSQLPVQVRFEAEPT